MVRHMKSVKSTNNFVVVFPGVAFSNAGVRQLEGLLPQSTSGLVLLFDVHLGFCCAWDSHNGTRAARVDIMVQLTPELSPFPHLPCQVDKFLDGVGCRNLGLLWCRHG